MILKRCIKAWLLVMGCLVMLTGCWDSVEMNELAMVIGSGFDITEDGLVEATVQIASPTGMPTSLAGSGAGKKRPAIVFSQKGKDSIDVLKKMQDQLSRRFFLGHRGIIILGEEYARQGIDQFLDQLLRSPDSRYSSYVLTSYGATAKELINSAFTLENIPTIGLKKMQKDGNVTAVRLDQFMDSLATDTESTFTGAIRFSQGKGSERMIRMDKTAIYRENKLAGFLNEEETRLLLWVKGDLKQTMMTAQIKPETELLKGTVSINSLESRSVIKTTIKDGKPHITVKLETEATVLSNDSSLDLGKDKYVRMVENKFADYTHKQFEKLLYRSQHELNEDIFDLGEEIHNEHPYFWKKIKESWKDRYRDVPVSVEVEFHIERTGRTQAPAHLHK